MAATPTPTATPPVRSSIPGATIGATNQMPTGIPATLDKDQASDGTRLDLWTTLQQKNLAKTGMSEADQHILSQMTAANRAGGWLSIYVPGQNDPAIHITPNKSVLMNTDNMPVGSDTQIDALLRGTEVAKGVTNNSGAYLHATDQKTLLILAKCAELEGVQVNNPPRQKLDDVDPALAREVEARWRLMGGQQPGPRLVNTSTDNLVRNASALDRAPDVNTQFAGATTPTVTPTASPVPTPVLTPTATPAPLTPNAP